MYSEMIVYLDNSATTRPLPEVRSAVAKALDEDFGNPSSLYSLGLSAEKMLKAARKTIAKSIGASEQELYFTSGGTEADNTAIFGAYNSRKKQGSRIITTEVEHPAVLRCFDELKNRGADVVFVPVKADGNLDMAAFEASLTPDTIFVSVMHVNNETGAIFPIKKIGEILTSFAASHNIPRPIFHSDCVQSYGKLPLDVKELGVDMISISGHKVHGPKGIGALYVKKGLHIPSFVFGGGQETGFRSGTENVPGICGFGAAAELIKPSEYPERNYMRDRILAEIPDVKLNSPEDSCTSVLNMSFVGCRAEVLLHMLEQDNIFVSTGSACSSKSKGSHVLSAMGLRPEEIEGALRFSFCHQNTKEEVDFAVDRLKYYVNNQRVLRKAFKKR